MARRFYDAGGAGREEARTLAGISLAYQGRYAEAIRDGKLGLVTTPVRWSADRHAILARIYALAGEPARAMDEIAEAYRLYPSAVLPGVVRLDPIFTALRNDPRVPPLHGPIARN